MEILKVLKEHYVNTGRSRNDHGMVYGTRKKSMGRRDENER